MSDREHFEKRAESLERRHEEENLMLQKRQEEYRVIEEVFDRLTLEGVVKLEGGKGLLGTGPGGGRTRHKDLLHFDSRV